MYVIEHKMDKDLICDNHIKGDRAIKQQNFCLLPMLMYLFN